MPGREHWFFAGMVAAGVLAFEMVRADDARPDESALRSAVQKSLPLLVAGAKGSMEQRKQCFTCHNQGLPLLALTLARTRGFEVDDEHLTSQLAFTAAFLAKNKEKYLVGKGQGGQVDTAGYALWTLDNGGWKGDDSTAAVAEYLLLYQGQADHWTSTSKRPPSEQSPFTTTYLALRGLHAFQTDDQKSRGDVRRQQARDWLVATPAHDTEDRVFRLRALALVDAPAETVRQAADELLAAQRDDGGWSQLSDMKSDAYATGSALVALHQAGGLAPTEKTYRRGIQFLLSNQLPDGSWHVVSRSKPFQTYFESGYPHGKDQFISIAAGGWATAALVLALPAH
ncbi:MAG: prenyltransferase/squalene oxidase repeat-containing protein [Pirellulaceae bacterium]